MVAGSHSSRAIASSFALRFRGSTLPEVALDAVFLQPMWAAIREGYWHV